jgi:hypothetical protein
MTNDLLPGDRYRGPLDLPRSEAVLASIAGGGAVVHFSVHQCTGFGAFAREQGACRQCQYIADIAATTRNRNRRRHVLARIADHKITDLAALLPWNCSRTVPVVRAA